mmetsp:Transcript_77660/g.251493  ORF Transcript_77660/g.251493 Transcript_77660/m.251493 type:complete len:213 (+) Transcript_77660:1183-1821(+)
MHPTDLEATLASLLATPLVAAHFPYLAPIASPDVAIEGVALNLFPRRGVRATNLLVVAAPLLLRRRPALAEVPGAGGAVEARAGADVGGAAWRRQLAGPGASSGVNPLVQGADVAPRIHAPEEAAGRVASGEALIDEILNLPRGVVQPLFATWAALRLQGPAPQANGLQRAQGLLRRSLGRAGAARARREAALGADLFATLPLFGKLPKNAL